MAIGEFLIGEMVTDLYGSNYGKIVGVEKTLDRSFYIVEVEDMDGYRLPFEPHELCIA